MSIRSLPAVLSLIAATLCWSGCQSVGSKPATVTASTRALPASAVVEPVTESRAYVFGWGELSADLAKPRGGTSRGAPVTLAPAQVLPLPAIAATTANAFDCDHAAILALAGDYKVSFHFMETLGFAPEHTPTRPYHSWATEHVHVIKDTGRFISLQHTLVMFFKKDDGTIEGPSLVKHWRQDWTYEDADLHTFRGARTWARERRAPEAVAGTWTQAVFQVDDSPRYEAAGRWTHDGNRSAWSGETSWRPLPRREFSVRQDYEVMEGQHRIVLTPTGWLHVQDNWKRVAGDASPDAAFIAHEYGLDRYERITAPSLAAADENWAKTGAYWAAVRAAWREVFAQHDRFELRAEVEGPRLFEEHFAYAERLAAGAPFVAADAARHARETIDRFLRATALPPAVVSAPRQ